MGESVYPGRWKEQAIWAETVASHGSPPPLEEFHVSHLNEEFAAPQEWPAVREHKEKFIDQDGIHFWNQLAVICFIIIIFPLT
jgi:hypothetical protein